MVLVKKIAIVNLTVHVMRAMVAHDVKHKLVCNKRARTFSSSSSFSFLLAFICFYSVRNDATITHNRLPLASRVVCGEQERHKDREKKKKEDKKIKTLISPTHACTRVHQCTNALGQTSITPFVKIAANLILLSFFFCSTYMSPG